MDQKYRGAFVIGENGAQGALYAIEEAFAGRFFHFFPGGEECPNQVGSPLLIVYGQLGAGTNCMALNAP